MKEKHGTNYRVGSSADILCKYLFFLPLRWYLGHKRNQCTLDSGVGREGTESSWDQQEAVEIKMTKDKRESVQIQNYAL